MFFMSEVMFWNVIFVPSDNVTARPPEPIFWVG